MGRFVLTAAFLLFVIVTSSNLILAKRYDITPGFKIINNNATLGSFTDPATGAGYRILKTDSGDEIVSDKGTFRLAFYDPKGTGEDYFLSVLLSPGKNRSLVPVWTANYNSSVSQGSTLMLTQLHQKLILLDGGASGTNKWNPGVPGVSGIELDESGNLIQYSNATGSAVWESFKQPTDVLVPGQKLEPGMSMISLNVTSASSMRAGQFVGTMEASGFVLYVLPESEVTMTNILRKPQPYRVWSIHGSAGNSLESAKEICGTSSAVMKFTTNIISVSYENPTATCGFSSTIFQRQGNGGGFQYLKLEENGDLVVYEFNDGAWDVVFRLSQQAGDACKLPTACGSYGFCSGQGESSCKCVGDSEVKSGVTPCKPPPGVSVSCLTNEVQNHHFVVVGGASYFSNSFTKADKERSSEKECLSLCAANCSCAAAFYEKSGGCYLVDEVMGSLTLDPSREDSTGFVKIQNSILISEPLTSKAKGSSRSARTAIIFLAVLCLCLVLLLLGAAWLVKFKYPHAYNKIMRR